MWTALIFDNIADENIEKDFTEFPVSKENFVHILFDTEPVMKINGKLFC